MRLFGKVFLLIGVVLVLSTIVFSALVLLRLERALVTSPPSLRVDLARGAGLATSFALVLAGGSALIILRPVSRAASRLRHTLGGVVPGADASFLAAADDDGGAFGGGLAAVGDELAGLERALGGAASQP